MITIKIDPIEKCPVCGGEIEARAGVFGSIWMACKACGVRGPSVFAGGSTLAAVAWAYQEMKENKGDGQWTYGDPLEAMWCLATYLTNDTPPSHAVVYLWFNAGASIQRDKWWTGQPGRCTHFLQPVIAWMPIPKPVEVKILSPHEGPVSYRQGPKFSAPLHMKDRGAGSAHG